MDVLLQTIPFPSFADAISTIASIIFAYAVTPAFFAVVSEMRTPQVYTTPMSVCQSFVTVAYVTISMMVY